MWRPWQRVQERARSLVFSKRRAPRRISNASLSISFSTNRIDPGLFRDCFVAWVAECWPDRLDLVAIDGKTSRRTHNHRTGDKALHLVSALATNSRLVLGQEAVFEKSNEITAIPALIERLDLVGALVSIDTMGCQVAIAQSILDAGADYLLAVKDNQPTLHAEIESYFATAPASEVEKAETIGKDHGRFELPNYSVSHRLDWYTAERSYPGAPRFPQLTTIAIVESRIERSGTIQTERRSLPHLPFDQPWGSLEARSRIHVTEL
jgi:predicted transposase YbfD/YdcC